MERILSNSEKENAKAAEKALDLLKQRELNVVFLQGNLGAGKTSLTRYIAQLLNSKNRVNSPTFVIQKIYYLNDNTYNFKKIIHMDLYRLQSTNEVEDIGILEEMDKKEVLYIIEWPELLLSKNIDHLNIQIDSTSNGGRSFVFT